MKKNSSSREWKGYSFDELKEQQALNDARIMLQKMKLEDTLSSLRHPLAGRTNGGVFRKMFSALGYMDYIVMGIALMRRLKPLWRLVSRKKK